MTILTILKILLGFFIALFIKELFSRSKKTDFLYFHFKSKLEELIKENEELKEEINNLTNN
jgi:predicted nuclease with TOPRIM domain